MNWSRSSASSAAMRAKVPSSSGPRRMKFLECAPRSSGRAPCAARGEGQGARTPVKERYQDIDDKSEELRDWLELNARAGEFLQKFEMSWIYHDSALEGTV